MITTLDSGSWSSGTSVGTVSRPLTITASGLGSSPSRSRFARSSSFFTIGP